MQDSIYKEFGVEPIINAAGTFSHLGGSLMPPEVVSAWCEAAKHFVDMNELQDRVGERLAAMLNVEAAIVTGGAAAGILLATAAAICQRDPEFVSRQHGDENHLPFEVLRQASHRDLYDRQIETCGARIVDVHTVADAEGCINDRTIMMMAFNVYEPESSIRHEEWIQLAKRSSLPTLLDAAADTPPIENLWKYNQMGFDMVVFSGGKAIRGPQGTGLLLGGKQLLEAAKQNAFPTEGTIGRAAKVSKEDTVALYVAVELYLKHGHEIVDRCTRQLQAIAEVLSEVPTASTEMIMPPVANRFPHLLVHWDERYLRVTPARVKTDLMMGRPRIATDRVYGTGTNGFLLSAINLEAGQEQLVAERMKQLLSESRRRDSERFAP